MNYFGNKEILNNYKVGFLCSRKVPANIILKTYDWAVEQRDRGICVVSGFHSKIEKDVFEILVKGTQPIIIVLARGMMKRFEDRLIEMIEKNRILIISPFEDKVKRITVPNAYIRNKLIMEISDEIFIPFISENGSLNSLIKNYSFKVKNEFK